MNRQNSRLLAFAMFSTGLALLASCTSEPQPQPTAAEASLQSNVIAQKGVAGGVVEDVFMVQAVVTAIDQPSRRVTLTGSDNTSYTFTAGPEIRNLAQVRVGDKVTSTFSRRVAILVQSPDQPQPAAYAATANRTALGDKPGALVAEEYSVRATVRSIDAANRTAVLGFSDGDQRTVPIRQDVDLSRYKAGDIVVVRVTAALTVLVQTP